MKLKTIFYILAGLLLLSLSISLPLIFGFGKTGKNTTILGRDFSLLNKTQIISRLQTDFSLPAAITLHSDGQDFSLPLATFSAGINYSQTASNLLYRRLNNGIYNYFHAFFQPKNFTLEVFYNPDSLNQYLSGVASQVDRPFIPSEIEFDSGGKLQIKEGQVGQKTDISSLSGSIIKSLKNYTLKNPVQIPTDPVGSLPSPADETAALNRAQKLVGKTLTLTGADAPIVLTDHDLVSWIAFGQDCRQDNIDNYLSSLSSSVNHSPVDAVFDFENGKVLQFQPAQPGQNLDTDKFSAEICGQINGLIATSSSTLAYKLPLNPIEPSVKTGDVNNLGIIELLGKGESTFHHSNTDRNYNIEKGASIINRILVAPGDTFSFIKNLGPVSAANGFKEAYVILQGHTELDYGGGICQVSTTLFRAMLNAGLDITDRQAHAYRVSYYEEDSKPGFDATVFIPSPDLRFVNDTGHYVLIQSHFDGVNKSLTYEIYGTSDGRQVSVSNYHQWDAAPAPPAIYIDDPTLKPGQTVQDEHAIPGLKVAFDWKVIRDGQVIHQKTYESDYVPWAAVYRQGPQVNP